MSEILTRYVSTVAPRAQRFINGNPAVADLTGIPKLERPVDTAALKRLGFEFVVLHKQRVNSYRDRVRAELEPNDIVGRRIAGRLGGIPDELFERLRSEFSESCGGPKFEDETIIVFSLPGCRAVAAGEPQDSRVQ